MSIHQFPVLQSGAGLAGVDDGAVAAGTETGIGIVVTSGTTTGQLPGTVCGGFMFLYLRRLPFHTSPGCDLNPDPPPGNRIGGAGDGAQAQLEGSESVGSRETG